VENLQHFLRDFPNAQTIRLEQNYRSTATILNSANKVIGNNSDRLGKDLWTEGQEGEQISLYAAFNEQEESRYIVSQIKRWQDQGGALSDVALLYRNNAQSRVLEEGLLYAGLAYRIYGGLRFFDRQEVKDAVAYLRLVSNRQDDAAFERVVNTPTRGIGERTLGLVRELARGRQLTMWDAARVMVQESLLSGRAKSAVAGFLDLIN
jgi:DNA helicase-2/ATP-dependent DNA helicase PcrA